MLTKPKKVRSWEKNLMSWIARFFFPQFSESQCDARTAHADLISRFPSCSFFFFFCVADSFLFKAFFKDNLRSADFLKNHYCKKLGMGLELNWSNIRTK